MTGKAFRRLVAEPQLQIVAVRADQAHAALQFGVTSAGQRGQQCGLQELRVLGGALVVQFDRAAIPDGRRP